MNPEPYSLGLGATPLSLRIPDPTAPSQAPQGLDLLASMELSPAAQRMLAETEQRDAEEQARQQHLETLQSVHGKGETAINQFMRGALSSVLWGGSLLGAGLESAGAVTGIESLEKTGRELGISSTPDEAAAIVAFLAEGGGKDGLREYDATKRDLKEEAEAWQTLSTVSQLAGATAASFGLGMGASGKAFTGMGPAWERMATMGSHGASNLARVGTSAALGAVEGSGIAAGGAYAQGAPLRDVLVSTALGGSLGALVGAGAEGALIGAHKLSNAGRKFFTREAMGEKSAELAAKAIGVKPSDLQGVSPEKWQQTLRDVMDMRLESGKSVFEIGDNVGKVAKKLTELREEVGAKLGLVRQNLDEAIEATGRTDLAFDPTRFRQQADEWLAGIEPTASKTIVSRAKNALAEFDNLVGKAPSKLEGEIDRAFAAQPTMKFGEAAKWRKDNIDAILFPESRSGWRPPPENAQQLFDLRRMFEAELDAQFDRAVAEALPESAGLNRALKAQFAAVAPVQQSAAKAANADALAPATSLIERAAGIGTGAWSMATGNPMPVITGAASAGVSKVLRERGDIAMAVLLGRMSRKGYEKLDDAIRELIPKNQVMPDALLWMTRRSVIKNLKKIAHVLQHDAPELTKIATGEHVRHTYAVPHGESSTERGAKKALITGASTLSMSREDKAELYRQRRDLVRNTIVASDTSPIDEGLSIVPGMTTAFQARLSMDFQRKLVQLQQDMPKPKPSLRGKAWETLSSEDVRKGNAMFEATTDPGSVFDDFARGVVDYDKVQYAWKQYPGLKTAYQAGLADMLYTQMEESDRAALPDAILTQLDYMFDMGGKLQPSVAPQFLQQIEAIVAENAQAEQQAAPPQNGNLELPTARPTFTQRLSGATQ